MFILTPILFELILMKIAIKIQGLESRLKMTKDLLKVFVSGKKSASSLCAPYVL